MRGAYAIAIFLSAFLLFQVQPLIGRYIMPWFGTTPGVWAACLVFFQLMLLAGYGYAHFISSRLSTPNQVRVHIVLLVAALFALPIIPSPGWKTMGEFDPALRIILLLAATVGIPYLLLSSTSPLLQKWFSVSTAGASKTSTYRLYAISNAGSLLALVSYPLFFERHFKLQTQTITWSAGFLAFVILVVLVARSHSKSGLAKTAETEAAPDEASGKKKRPAKKENSMGDSPDSVAWRKIMVWFALSATGSVMLLATTNRLCQDVPATPFLFVLPLGIYLITFIIAFDNPRWYVRPVFCVVLMVGMIAACTELYRSIDLELSTRIGIYAVALFSCCICCHGELARLKPDTKHLTLFYFILALGGASGGVFVALFAPVFFNGFWEYEIGLLASFALVMILNLGDLHRRSRPAKAVRVKKKAGRIRKVRVSQKPEITPGFARLMTGVASLAFVALLSAVAYRQMDEGDGVIAQDRSFYGVARIVESEPERSNTHRYKLYHGEIIHGMQLRRPDLRSAKLAYYGDKSGIGLAIHQHPKRFNPRYGFRIGVVGLGAGSIAAFANEHRKPAGPEDYVHFYEIDPMIARFAEGYFSYLEDARDRGADIRVSLGDARIVMERQLEAGTPEKFDVLAVDAFSGDSVPTHLLTDECFQVYLAHMKPDGVLGFHLSSRYLDLVPVIKALAERHGCQTHFIRQPSDKRGGASNRWALVTKNGIFSENRVVKNRQISIDPWPSVLWTDDYSSLFDVIP